MPHDTPLISTIVAGLVLAFLLGAVANRLRLPPLFGYLLAGVVVGPYTPGFVADAELATELAEIGVILLMFGVGLHFSLRDLLSVRAVAVPGALVQIIGATAMGTGLGLLLGWDLVAGMIFGLALSVASTVVLLRTLQERHIIDSERGRIAVGWLIVEDVVIILALVIIPSLATILGSSGAGLADPLVRTLERLFNVELGIPGLVAITVLKIAAFVGFMLVVGRRVIPMLLHFTAHTGSRELFRLAVLSIALGVAAGSAYLFGVSLALGAFFAGMMLAESELSHRAAQETLPLRDAFAVLFFVSVGMLFDPSILWRDPLPVLATLFIILIGKSALAFLIVRAFGRSTSTGLTISASLAQIGELSFILATLGVALGLLPVEGRDLILAGAILSILLNPVLFNASVALKPRLEAANAAADGTSVRGEPQTLAAEVVDVPPEEEPEHPTAQTAHTVLIGYGRVGSVIAEGLKGADQPFLVIEDSDARIAVAREHGIEVIAGNAAGGKPLRLANVEGASTIIVAIPNAFEAGQAVEQCRRANPDAMIVARAHSDEESSYLSNRGANTVIMGEREIGLAMLEIASPGSSVAAAGRQAVASALDVSVEAAPLVAAPRATVETLDEAALAAAIGVPAEPVADASVVPEALPVAPPQRVPAHQPGVPFGLSPAKGLEPAGEA